LVGSPTADDLRMAVGRQAMSVRVERIRMAALIDAVLR
jgi:hypothetical protein